MNSYPSILIQSFIYFQHFLGTDATTSKYTKNRSIKENRNQPKDPDILDVRRTVSTRSPLSDLKCPKQIVIFLGQDDCFYLSTKSCLNHCHHPALKVDAILGGQNDMEQVDLMLLSLLFSINATGG